MNNKYGLSIERQLSYAKSRIIRLADQVFNVYQCTGDYQRKHLLKSPYCMSQDQVARVISKSPTSIQDFLNPRRGTTLLGNVAEPADLPEFGVEGCHSVIKPISLKSVGLYWLQWAILGNTAAINLVSALMEKSLLERAKEVFLFQHTQVESLPSLEVKLPSQPWTVGDEIQPVSIPIQEFRDRQENQTNPAPDELKLRQEIQRLKDKLALAEQQYQDLFNTYPVLIDNQGIKLYTLDFTVEEVRKMLELPSSDAARDLVYRVTKMQSKIGDGQPKNVSICTPTLTAKEHSALVAKACNELLAEEEEFKPRSLPNVSDYYYGTDNFVTAIM